MRLGLSSHPGTIDGAETLAELRRVGRGKMITEHVRLDKGSSPSGDWTLAETCERGDMPTDLQVGAVVYANTLHCCTLTPDGAVRQSTKSD